MKNEIIEVLSQAEAIALVQYENAVTDGLRTFYVVGEALMAIRDQRLYRGTHKTFEEFVISKWDMGKAHAYRLIAGAEVVGNVSHGRQIPEVTERTLRPLAKLTPAKQRKAWAKLDKSKSITVSAVVQAVAKVQPADQAIRPIDQKADLPPTPAPQVLADPLDDPVVKFKTKALIKFLAWQSPRIDPYATTSPPRHVEYRDFITALLK